MKKEDVDRLEKEILKLPVETEEELQRRFWLEA
jgi:hypothetical protein